jgi:hypothetical protein
MGRIWLLAALLYGYGHPGFDGHRPAALDRPLQNLHRAVDRTASNARLALLALEDKVQPIRSLLASLRQLNEVF